MTDSLLSRLQDAPVGTRDWSDDEILQCVADFREGFLGDNTSDLMCAALCWPLVGFLRFAGIDAEADTREIPDEGYPGNHVWIRLADGRVLDPTADQFPDLGLPAVYLGKPVAPIHVAAKEGT
jgi:hypothetical protein